MRLVEDIWDSIAAHPETLAVTEAQKRELDRRVAEYRTDPNQGRTWEEVQDSLDDES
ncbi:MAG: hypothetical protein BMS9Abin10_0762 [Gammaproteobacteria bacterium]|nr:MAG: hypothetical protein BMS9Abin10_0762 [Gammaproteobacteria bacterium]